jgi:hypothetical protein
MVDPGASTGKRAVFQVPNMMPPQQFPGTGPKIDYRTEGQIAADAKRDYAVSQRQHKEWIAEKNQEFLEEHGMPEKQFKRLSKHEQERQRWIIKNNRKAAIEKQKIAEEERRVAMQVQEMQRSNPALSIPRSANADQPLPPRVMESVNKSLMRASALSDSMRALPPHIAVDVLSKAQFQAGENRRAQELRDHLEAMRRVESQQLFERARNNEGMVKQQDAQRNQRQNDELLKQRLLAISKAKK